MDDWRVRMKEGRPGLPVVVLNGTGSTAGHDRPERAAHFNWYTRHI